MKAGVTSLMPGRIGMELVNLRIQPVNQRLKQVPTRLICWVLRINLSTIRLKPVLTRMQARVKQGIALRWQRINQCTTSLQLATINYGPEFHQCRQDFNQWVWVKSRSQPTGGTRSESNCYSLELSLGHKRMESLLEILELETGKLTTANRTWAVDKKKCTDSPGSVTAFTELNRC